MNKYDWNNPPPPGTEFDLPDEDTNQSSPNAESTSTNDQGSSQVNSPSPVVKAPSEEPPVVEKQREPSRSKSPEKRRRRRRSKSRSRWSRSFSRDKRRRSRSRSRRRRRRYSSSRSRSRSYSPDYRYRNRRRVRRYSRSRSRSVAKKSRSYRSRSHSHSHSSRSYRSERGRKSPRSKHVEERRDSDYDGKAIEGDVIGEEDMKIEDEEEEEYDEEMFMQPEPEPEPEGPIPFKNDGSFLEMFKRMQEQQKVKEEPPTETEVKKPLLPAFGKRRGGKVLKTGMVAKLKSKEDEAGGTTAQDAWSIYMSEVRKYKEVHCDDDSKTRPLVK